MDDRVGSVNRVINAMEELDHSELTRGNVRAASRAMESMQSQVAKDKGVNSQADSFAKLISMAERGNWTELRNARNNGLMPAARDEINSLMQYFADKHMSPDSFQSTPSVTSNVAPRKPTPDRGYPFQHTVESEKEFQRRRTQANKDFGRDRRSFDVYSEPVDYDRYGQRQRDDPKQVSNQISRIAADKLRTGAQSNVDEVSSPKELADLFTDLYNQQWTAAYEELNKSYRDGGETITQLNRILQNAYEYCEKTADRQMSNMLMHVEDEMLYPNVSKESRANLEAQQRPDRRLIAIVRDGDDAIKEFRRQAASASLPFIKWLFYEEVMKTIQPAQHPTSYQVSFTDRCLELCWAACTQTPPLSLHFCQQGDRMDQSRFRPFTRIGNTVQHCVWPAVHSHKNGSVLEKGVAHCS